MVDGLVLLQLGGDRRLHRRHVLAVDVEDLGLPLEALPDAGAAGFQRDLALLLDDADDLLGAVLLQTFARGDPGELLVLTEVLLHAHRLAVVEARVERDDGNALVQRGLDRGAIASGLASVRAMPLTPLSIAVWTRFAWFGASGSLE